MIKVLVVIHSQVVAMAVFAFGIAEYLSLFLLWNLVKASL